MDRHVRDVIHYEEEGGGGEEEEEAAERRLKRAFMARTCISSAGM